MSGPVVQCSPEAAPAKEAGNKAFAAKRFEEAHEHFSEAIRLDPRSALLRSNRAGALASMGRHAEALADAEVCTLLQPDWWKGHTRKGHAQFNLELYAEAENSFQAALLLNPQESSIREGLARAQQRREEKAGGGIGGGGGGGGGATESAALRTAASAASDPAPAAEPMEVGPEFQRLNPEQVQERIERGVDQLTDAELDAELRKSGVNLPEDASRAVKVRLYLDISAAMQAQVNGAPKKEFKPLRKDYDSKGEEMLDRRKRWLDEWSTWDDARLKKQLRKRGFDAEALSRADLIDLLLQVETDRANRRTCTPARLQLCGMVTAGLCTLGTFVVVAAVFTQ